MTYVVFGGASPALVAVLDSYLQQKETKIEQFHVLLFMLSTPSSIRRHDLAHPEIVSGRPELLSLTSRVISLLHGCGESPHRLQISVKMNVLLSHSSVVSSAALLKSKYVTEKERI